IMEKDKELSSDMKYIAIDMKNFDELTKQDKSEILSYFKEKYKVEVIDMSLDELKEKGLFNSNTMSLDGVLLRIKKVDYKPFNNVLFEGSKYRSGKGSTVVETKIHFKDGEWKVKESKETQKS
ncbi:peptide ABC transporter substrate-binding protein, partial [Heyndrickxia sporothermodurans]